ncbi:MAG TPA: DNA-directed RNA polymerase subunit beta, partial [bacterium]|nr:DNA-directed RNA polymerase subunit beta [bacterium]
MKIKKRYFNKTKLKPIDSPPLLELPTKSFHNFLQQDVPADKRKRQGLQAAFLDIFPVTNADASLRLEFVSYRLGEPKFTPEECKEFDLTYSTPLWLTLRLVEERVGKNPIIKEQEVYVCDVPYMTDTGSYIYNGKERVIVTQIHRSPGVSFGSGPEKVVTIYGKKLFRANIIPYRGSWMEFEFDLENAVWAILDRKKKFPATQILRAIGLESNQSIVGKYYRTKEVSLKDAMGQILAEDIIDKEDKTKFIFEAGLTKVNDFVVAQLTKDGKTSIRVVEWDQTTNDVAILETLKKDKTRTQALAIADIFRKLRTQQEYAVEFNTAREFWETFYFKTIRRYDLSRVGRFRLNQKLKEVMEEMGMEMPAENRRNLTQEDILATLKYLIDLQNEVSAMRSVDDIDHLGSRRVRPVGEMLENQFRIGLSHAVRITREKMILQKEGSMTPRELFTPQPVAGVIRKFFGVFPLSQYMQQVNPLDELTHKRRLSAMGTGGLSRRHAGPEVRDVHHSHYGRICPIETPEGANIGLITSLALYARVNDFGLIETPYRKVEHGRVTDKVDYLTADREEDFTVAQANAQIDDKGDIKGLVVARRREEFPLVEGKEVDYIDASPQQLVGVSASLVPFLEHDDANRALMGSNMQRQAVPLLLPEVPLVATGNEAKAAKDSGAVVVAREEGVILSADSEKIIVKKENGEYHTYHLIKYSRSNQDTAINQRPLV